VISPLLANLYLHYAFDVWAERWRRRESRLHGEAVSGSSIDITHAVLHVRRAKKGTPATHPVVGDEMRALRKLQREQDPKSPFVFTSERGSPFTRPDIWARQVASTINGRGTP
jgi:hypothetical protein